MKINIFTKTMLGMGLVCASVPAFALEAWNNQQGGDKYQVIFDGKVYENAWWVSSTNCPANAKPNDASNPWRYERDATAQEISQIGNPQSCNSDQKPVEPVVPDTTPVTPVPATDNTDNTDNTDKAEEYAIEAWQHQEGGTTWHVIYDGAIYQNAWWVAASNCPGNAKADDASNPWRYLRDATAAEEAKYGNPTSCDTDGEDDVPVPPAPPVPDPVPSDDPTPSQDDDSTYALEAWSGQEGSTIYHVIFDGNVYKNAWWVGSKDCPLTASPTNANNPWTFERVATPAEISQYGNPQTCEIAGNDTTTYPAWSNESAYNANDKVEYNNATYVTQKAQDAWGFAPGGDNPWQKYEAVQPWSASTVYVKGDRVVVDGMVYEALFWTQHDDPSDVANQNPTGDNSRPWKPLGKLVEYSSEELSNAPQYDAGTLYENGTLIRFNGENYVAQTKVQKVSPTDTNPWRIFVDWKGTKERVGTPKNSWPKHVYAPYVDFTLNTIPDFAALAKNENVNHFTLAFVVSKDADTCLPTWGTSYGMQDYAQYSKIKALREAGGDVMLSIGGANNAPLAASCKNVDDLMQHYYDIVDNLNLQVLDFDIEGTWVADQASIERRNLAVKKVQDKWKSEGKDIGVWYTLPILPTGLTPDGMNVLRDAQAKGVELAGVNVMTMDYGNAICQSAGTEGQNIHGKCATSAIESLHTQLKGLFTEKSDAEIDAMMGTTPMIGLNDVQGETFYLSDARLVMEDAQKRKLGMIGIWSIARDVPGGNYVSPEFHGLTEQQAPKYAFSEIFAPFTKQ